MRNLITTIGAITILALVPAVQAENDAKEGAKAPAAAVDGGKLAKDMVGFWAPDPKAMLEQFKKEIGDDPNAAAMLPLVEAMLQNMAVEVKEGEVTIHMMGQQQTATYTITKVDEAASKLTMNVKDEEGVSEGTAVIKGDKLTLSKEGDGDVVLDRIKKDDFEKRKAAAQQPPAFPGLE